MSISELWNMKDERQARINEAVEGLSIQVCADCGARYMKKDGHECREVRDDNSSRC